MQNPIFFIKHMVVGVFVLVSLSCKEGWLPASHSKLFIIVSCALSAFSF